MTDPDPGERHAVVDYTELCGCGHTRLRHGLRGFSCRAYRCACEVFRAEVDR